MKAVQGKHLWGILFSLLIVAGCSAGKGDKAASDLGHGADASANDLALSDASPPDMPAPDAPPPDLAPPDASWPDLPAPDAAQDLTAPDLGALKTTWVRALASTGQDAVFDMVVDSSDNVYITGLAVTGATLAGQKVTFPSKGGMVVAKLDKSGKVLWTASVEGDLGLSGRLAVDSAGNVYLAGVFGFLQAAAGTKVTFGSTTLTAQGGYGDIFVAKLDNKGKFVWATAAGGLKRDYAYGLDLDSAGNLYLAGTFGSVPKYPFTGGGKATFGSTTLTASGPGDLFLAKMDSTGKFTWARRHGSASNDRVDDLAVSGSSLYLAGTFGYALNTPTPTMTLGKDTLTPKGMADMFVARFDLQGKPVWAVSGGSSLIDSASRIRVDSKGNATVLGVVQAGSTAVTATFGSITLLTAGQMDTIVARVNAAGKFTWAVNAGGPLGDGGAGLTLLPSGGCILSGITYLSIAQYEGLLARVDKAGKLLWTRPFCSGGANGISSAVAVDSAGKLLLTGRFENTAKFGATPLTSKGLVDGFIWKLATP